MFGYGIGYAVTSLSCTIGPFLADTGTTFRTGSILNGIVAYLAYAAGMALLVGVLATAIALAAAPVTTWLRGAMQHLTRVGGVLLVVAGAYVAYYGVFELRVSRSGDTSDPIIEAAAHLQQAMSTCVGTVGVLPIVLVLIILIGAGTGVFRWHQTARRQRRTDAEQYSWLVEVHAEPDGALPRGVCVVTHPSSARADAH